jgi:hypothetical protein
MLTLFGGASMRNAVISCSVLTFLLTGCPDRTISKVEPQQGRVEYKDIPIKLNRKIDLLFVIDDSPSMLDKQTNLKANFANFINVLNTIEGGLPDIHIGVVTSDLGTKGADDATAGPPIGSGQGACSGSGKSGNLRTDPSVTGPFISDTLNADGSRTTNYTGSLTAAFSALASAGANGCGFEQHIEAAKRALVATNTANTGFLRSDALLAIVIIADEDDCSMSKSSLLGPDINTLGALQSFRCTRFGITCATGGADSNAMNQVGPKANCNSNESSAYLTKISGYVSFFKGLKSDPNNVIVAAIAGAPTPFDVELRVPPGGGTAIPALAHSCSYTDAMNTTQVADPPTRIKQFLDSFPNRSTFSTICQQDLSGGLTLIAQLLKTVIGSPCIDGTLADVDPNTPGPQYDCSVSDITKYGKPDQKETVLPECNNLTTPASSTNLPCWAIEMDTAKCMSGSHLKLNIERGGTTPPDDTHVVSYCVTQAGCNTNADCAAPTPTCNVPTHTCM